ncbi:hypothetical protein J6590_107763 [Homalodisca vitripennis]|nr:hypothetical protein J6590_107763 [Homalodisca vitripennis]
MALEGLLLPEWSLERGLEQITQDAGVADVPSLILRVLGERTGTDNSRRRCRRCSFSYTACSRVNDASYTSLVSVVCFMLLPEWSLERGLEQITQDAGVADVPSLILRVLG